MKDLIESLTKHDVAHYAGINRKVVKAQCVVELLENLGVTNAVQFGKVFNNRKPFHKFAGMYRDIYVFGLNFETAKELAE